MKIVQLATILLIENEILNNTSCYIGTNRIALVFF